MKKGPAERPKTIDNQQWDALCAEIRRWRHVIGFANTLRARGMSSGNRIGSVRNAQSKNA